MQYPHKKIGFFEAKEFNVIETLSEAGEYMKKEFYGANILCID